MPVSSGNQILAADFNDLSTLITTTLGTGAGQYGYGQAIVSGTVTAGQRIEKQEFDKLRFDLMSVLIHQTGVLPSPVFANITNPILATASEPFQSYTNLIQAARGDRFVVSQKNQSVDTIDTKTCGTWSNLAVSELEMTFASANDARYFWNSGSRIRIDTNLLDGYPSTQQNNDWNTILDSSGNVEFGANAQTTGPGGGVPINAYDLTNSYQTFYEFTSSAPYAANRYKLSAKCNQPSNLTGVATVFTLKIELIDDYTDDPQPGPLPDDEVFGVEIECQHVKVTGTLQPDLDPWVLPVLTFNMSNITAA